MLQDRMAGFLAGGVVHNLDRTPVMPLLCGLGAALRFVVAAAVAILVARGRALAPEARVIGCMAAVLRTRASPSQISMHGRIWLINLQRPIQHLRFVVWLPRRKTVRIILLSMLLPGIKSSVFRDTGQDVRLAVTVGMAAMDAVAAVAAVAPEAAVAAVMTVAMAVTLPRMHVHMMPLVIMAVAMTVTVAVAMIQRRYRRATSPKLPQRNGALVAARHLAHIVLR
mmetsp:Transcript_148386/g.474973  ORF Transcript_148386/g.474973 Transcript_148386/m.474973 type:complete len:225 (-) Transcript_148386:136-810(-)